MTNMQKAFDLFDQYNKQDPHVFTFSGVDYPQEYFLSLQLYDWVCKLYPDADEALLLASRSQHIGRWEMPRSSYPDGREAYLKWRKDLAQHHFQVASNLVLEAGYHEDMVEAIRPILLKQKIKVDNNVQAIENALCLVFLEFQYEQFYKTQNPDKLVNILWKSLLKMDPLGHQHALKIHYSQEGLVYVQKAVEKLHAKS